MPSTNARTTMARHDDLISDRARIQTRPTARYFFGAQIPMFAI